MPESDNLMRHVGSAGDVTKVAHLLVTLVIEVWVLRWHKKVGPIEMEGWKVWEIGKTLGVHQQKDVTWRRWCSWMDNGRITHNKFF
ncbi:hypothetical protein JTE90_018550 [Oedothorax gibbosus]|uniref:Uncharacterized protein n=1 Tax=Oedothorax gibbosus TaxID=931172 RepID=A0AAV6V7I3_9ARAC|nr:hypothetical protein JTE90_018550 [Oedothorax gibbosus]